MRASLSVPEQRHRPSFRLVSDYKVGATSAFIPVVPVVGMTLPVVSICEQFSQSIHPTTTTVEYRYLRRFMSSALHSTTMTFTDGRSSNNVTNNEGSWLPLIVIITIVFARWLCYGQGTFPVQIRRAFQTQVRSDKFRFAPEHTESLWRIPIVNYPKFVYIPSRTDSFEARRTYTPTFCSMSFCHKNTHKISPKRCENHLLTVDRK